MYQLGTAIHRNFYSVKLLRKTRLPVPVIGIGNLSFGGSGKTLVTETIARKMAAEGKRIGVVCRSYGAEAGPHVLSDEHCDPYVVGDEAAMLFSEGDRKVIASGRDKTHASQALLERCPDIDVVVVDDAFQHHQLHQDLRVVIWPKPGALLRDFLSAADGADVLLVPNGLRSPRPEEETVYFVKEVVGIQKLTTEDTESAEKRVDTTPLHPSASSVLSVANSFLITAGLGPENDFFHQIEKFLPKDIVRFTECLFPDHVDYRRPEIQARLTAAAAGCDAILTTAKDAVKLRRLVIPLPPIYVVRVAIRTLTNEELLWRKIRSVII